MDAASLAAAELRLVAFGGGVMVPLMATMFSDADPIESHCIWLDETEKAAVRAGGGAALSAAHARGSLLADYVLDSFDVSLVALLGGSVLHGWRTQRRRPRCRRTTRTWSRTLTASRGRRSCARASWSSGPPRAPR